jgi:hypothetical protein
MFIFELNAFNSFIFSLEQKILKMFYQFLPPNTVHVFYVLQLRNVDLRVQVLLNSLQLFVRFVLRNVQSELLVNVFSFTHLQDVLSKF